MFETLASKTFAILAVSLCFAYAGSMLAASKIRKALQFNDAAAVSRTLWTAIIVNIIAFVVLMFTANKSPINMITMAIFTLSSGATLSIYFVRDADTAQKALLITAATTLLTGLIATYSGIDFSGLGKFLFIALIILVIVSIIGIFVRIKSGLQRIISAGGVLIFTGYLLYDFNRLAKLKNIVDANTWNTALSFAINIYLDIINLFIQLMNLMGSGKN